MKKEEFSPFDWDFDGVPNPELVACCYWEYERESKTLQDFWSKVAKRPNEAEHKRRFKFLLRQLEHSALIIECISTPYPTSDDPRSFPRPWQSLSESERKKRSHPICLSDIRHPVETAGLSDTTSLGEKAESAHREWIKELRSREHRHLPLVSPRGVNLIYFGMEVCAFNVLWEHFNNAKIIAAFAKWVEANRPTTIPEPADGSGHKPIDWRKKLRDLGVMRLMNCSTVAGMSVRCPEAARCFERWESKHWSAARKRALKNFRSLLPFLPEDELPLHASTKGGRAKL